MAGIALALGSVYPYVLPGLLFCAASLAASRILWGMHFLTDVFAGAALILVVNATGEKAPLSRELRESILARDPCAREATSENK